MRAPVGVGRILGTIAILLFFLAGASASPAAPSPPAPSQEIEGLTVDATTTYRLDEAAGVVRVRSEVTLTNTQPPVSTGIGIRTYFFDRFAVGALGPTTNARASRDGTGLAVTLDEPDAHFDFLVVDLSPNLTFGNPQNIVIEYDLPTQPNGSDAATRVNDAFATWYVSSVGDNGQSDVIIDVPERFELDAVTDASGQTEDVDGRTIATYEDLTPESGFFGVSARDDDALVIRSTTVDDDDYEIQAWPGDEAWADFAVDTVENGIPALVDFVGLDVEDEREITVAESSTPYLYGYGGWFLPADDRVEIGDEQDLHTMLHELAHLWYHTELFTSRWVTEGLAELAASRATSALGEDPLPVEPLDASAPGAQPLSEWDDAAPSDVSDVDDLYGYETSYALLSAVHDEIGTDALQSIVKRADDKLIPLSAGDDEGLRRVDDWRYFYDLLATTPDVDIAAIDALFDTYVWTDADRAAVAERNEHMAAFDELAAAHEWNAPVVVRKELADWSFDKATAAIEVSHRALDEVTAIGEVLEPIDAELIAVRDRYEEAGTVANLEQLIEDLPDFLAAARDLAALDSRIDDLSPVHRFGLVGRDIDGRQDAVADAFADGELGEMDDLVGEVDDVIGQAAPSAVALLLVPLIGLGVLVLGARELRGRRRVAAALASAGELADGVNEQAGESADDGAVDTDELKVAAEE